MKHDIKIGRYGFFITFDFDQLLEGFDWEAFSDSNKESGQILYRFFPRQRLVFVETSFTPTGVRVRPIQAQSKITMLPPATICAGNIIVSFVNMSSSSGSVSIFGGRRDSYESELICEINDLSKIGVVKEYVSTYDPYERLFIKKSGGGEIILSDLSVIVGKVKLMTNDSMVSLESDGLERANGVLRFREEAAQWSFFTITFYRV